MPIDTSDGGCYFNGAGYSALQMGDVYKHTQTSIGFKFKTYDEDALIFLAVDKPNVSIYIHTWIILVLSLINFTETVRVHLFEER